jgi:hypothetical protein
MTSVMRFMRLYQKLDFRLLVLLSTLFHLAIAERFLVKTAIH